MMAQDVMLFCRVLFNHSKGWAHGSDDRPGQNKALTLVTVPHGLNRSAQSLLPATRQTGKTRNPSDRGSLAEEWNRAAGER